jgi:hypothetical protein
MIPDGFNTVPYSIHVFMPYLMTLSVAQIIKHWVKVWLVNNKLDRMQDEETVA